MNGFTMGKSHGLRLAAIAATLVASAACPAQEPPEERTLRVATREVPPFAMRADDGSWRGISIDLVEQLRRDLGEDGPVQVDLVEMDLGPMIDAVAAGEVDVAAAALTINYEREQRVDFSHPYYSAGLGIAVRLDEGAIGFWGLTRAVLSPTFLRIVVGLLVTMLAVGVGVYLCERHVNKEQFGGGAVRGILSGLWWSAVTLTTVGYGDKVPKSPFGRAIGMAWMFSGLFIIASFTAAITSALTLTELRSHVSGPGDLPRVRVATVRDSTSAKYLAARRIGAHDYADIGQAVGALAEGLCDAVVYDAPVLRYEVRREHEGVLYVLPAEFERQDYALALPSESPLREAVNQALLRIKDGPAWEADLAELLGDQP